MRLQKRPEKELSKKRSPEEEPPKKKKKANPAVNRSPPTDISLDSIGGMDPIIQELEDLLIHPLLRTKGYTASGAKPPRGILLHGPSGCGKTLIANAVAAEFGFPFIAFSATSIVSGMSGESEKGLREKFEEARSLAPCLVFIDEIDAITQKRESAQGAMEKRIVAQLLMCMDDLSLEKTGGKVVIVLAATNHPDSLDPALRRAGRFDKEISIGVPSKTIREAILRTLTRKNPVASDVDFEQLANQTSGFVGTDLSRLVSIAGSIADKRHVDALVPPSSSPMDLGVDPAANSFRSRIQRVKQLAALSPSDADCGATRTSADFAAALAQVQPSLKREGFTTIPTTTFSSIGALKSTCEALKTRVVAPILEPEKYARYGDMPPTGVLLWGPPGCGKTLLAKAVANAAGASFIHAGGAELLSKYVGDSEKAVKHVFDRARNAVPTVIFFDEIDTLVPRRSQASNDASVRVVTTMLSELDGLGDRKGIYVVAATNRPDAIEPAMLRPGRLAVKLYVGLPEEEERVEILQTLARNMNKSAPNAVHDNALISIAEVARRCEGFSGADFAELLQRAKLDAISRDEGHGITESNISKAMEGMDPSVRTVEMQRYERLKQKYSREQL